MNKNKVQYFLLFAILTISLFSLSGCTNLQALGSTTTNIDKLAYVIALGFDSGTDGNSLKLTFQIAIPSGQSGESSGGTSSQSSNVVVNTIDCNSINSGISLMDSFISKKTNLSHCKVIIFSEEIASKGISEYLYTLANDPEIRPDANIIVSKGDAKSFIQNSQPTLEQITARYYEIATSSSKYTAYTEDATLSNFFANYTDTFQQPAAILGSINNTTTHQEGHKDSNNTTNSSYIAGQTPIKTDKTNIENMGIAVFCGDTLVGELNGLESICHMIVTNELQSCTISIPSPFENLSAIDLNVQKRKDTKVKGEIINGSPYITIDVNLKCVIHSLNKDSDYLKEENLKKIQEYANAYIEQNIYQYLYKTSKDYKSDIAGFGKYFKRKFLFQKDWEEFNWLSHYKNSFFKVNVTTNVESSYLILDA